MFNTLSVQPPDPLLSLIGQFDADRRAGKMDLGVGVYRGEDGRTPIFRSAKAAERRLVETQASKAYLGPEGDVAYLECVRTLVFGQELAARPMSGVQTPGGSGALRLAAELLAHGRRRILVGLPTWPNHLAIFAAVGLEVVTYPFFDRATQSIRFDAMVAAIEAAGAGDAVLLHASCHNPTGAVLDAGQWRALGEAIARRGLFALVDYAYQGFAEGPEKDSDNLKRLLSLVPEALVAVSSSKSFGLYRERAGALFAVAETDATAAVARSNLCTIARSMYSMPPDHGAAVVRTILEDDGLRQDWQDELAGMCARLKRLRRHLADGLAGRQPALAAVREQTGMFSLLPLSEAAILDLRATHGIYMPTSGRINIAGIKEADIPRLVAAMQDVL